MIPYSTNFESKLPTQDRYIGPNYYNCSGCKKCLPKTAFNTSNYFSYGIRFFCKDKALVASYYFVLKNDSYVLQDYDPN